MDAESSAAREEAAIALANLRDGGDGRGGAAAAVEAAGADDALDDADDAGARLGSLSAAAIVAAVDAAPHHGRLLRAACAAFASALEASAMLAGQARAAADLIDAGALRVVAGGFRRHHHSDASCEAALDCLAKLCRWQPRAALHLHSTGAVGPTIAALDEALRRGVHPVALSACALLHSLAVAQAVMLPLPPASLPVDPPTPPCPSCAPRGRRRRNKRRNKRRTRRTRRRARRRRRSWGGTHGRRSGGSPSHRSTASGMGRAARRRRPPDAAAARRPAAAAVREEPLTTDCSILSAESLGRALHASPRHAPLVHAAAAELRRQLLRRHRRLATPRPSASVSSASSSAPSSICVWRVGGGQRRPTPPHRRRRHRNRRRRRRAAIVAVVA